MKRRLKRTTSQYIIVSLISVIIIGTAFILIYFTVIRNIKINYQKQISLLSEQLNSNKVFVYEAKEDISAGDRISKDKLNYVQTNSNQPQEYFMTKEEIDQVSLIDIAAGTQILKGMLTQNVVQSDIREVEFKSFYINSNMSNNDYVDIRILFPNGEDYIVLSKKSIKNITLETNNCFLWLTEDEILNMSGAITDAYLYSGTKLYTTKYIEPNLQEASIPTYQPSLSTLMLMEQDKNIIERASQELNKQLRKELESRLLDSTTNREAGRIQTITDINHSTQTNPVDNPILENETLENRTREEYFTPDDSKDKEEIVEYGG